MKIGLKLRLASCLPVFGSVRISVEISLFISADTSCVALVQTSTTLLYFSVRVMIPSRYWLSMLSTSAEAASMMRFLESGISMSFTPILMPERVAYSYPMALIRSQRMTHALTPASR